MREVSVFKGVRDLIAEAERVFKRRLNKVLKFLTKEWLGLSKAVNLSKYGLDSNMNPMTGVPFTNEEWTKFDKALDGILDYLYGGHDDLVFKSLMLGRLISGEHLAGRKMEDIIHMGMNKINMPKFAIRRDERIIFEQSATYVTGLQESTRKDMRGMIINAHREKISPRRLASQLREALPEKITDYRRIAETEIVRNFNTGYLEKLRISKNDALVKGLVSGNACKHCVALISGKVFAITDGESDEVTIKGKTYPAIWASKNNIGKKTAQWEACIPLHPHCQCSWIPFIAGYDKADKALADALKMVEEGHDFGFGDGS